MKLCKSFNQFQLGLSMTPDMLQNVMNMNGIPWTNNLGSFQSTFLKKKCRLLKLIVDLFSITIHMPQRTSKILLVRLTANKNALLFQRRVTCFACYTVWFGVTRSDHNTVNDYFTQSRCTFNMRNFWLHRASQSAMNTMHYLTRIRFALVLQIIHITLHVKVHFCGICIVMSSSH